MKKVLFLLCLVQILPAWCSERADSVSAGIVSVINASGNISVSQSPALAPLVAPPAVPVMENESENTIPSQPQTTRSGYRVQVFDDNNPQTARAAAQSRRAMCEQLFPQWRAYVSFNSPYWQVKVGDFRTRGEAEAAMAEIREAYPSWGAYMRIVRERIHIVD